MTIKWDKKKHKEEIYTFISFKSVHSWDDICYPMMMMLKNNSFLFLLTLKTNSL